MITPAHTRNLPQVRQLPNWAGQSCLICHTAQIWHCQPSTCSGQWRTAYVEEDLVAWKRLCQLWNCGPGSAPRSFSKMVLRPGFIGGINVLNVTVTMLRGNSVLRKLSAKFVYIVCFVLSLDKVTLHQQALLFWYPLVINCHIWCYAWNQIY
jgi:hypothetical protein